MRNNRLLVSVISASLLVGPGIGYYLNTQQRTIPLISDPMEGINTYYATWETTSIATSHMEGFAGTNSEYVNTVSFDLPHLKEVRFIVNWTDDRATILNRGGLDTLTLQITSPDGSTVHDSAKSSPRTKKGSIEITVPVKTESLKPMTLHSRNLAEATSQLQDATNDSSRMNKAFTIRVSVQVGEIRPLKRMRDKGNDFDLAITPQYYTASIMKLANTDSNPMNPQGGLGGTNQTTEKLKAQIKAGPLLGYAPLVVNFYGNPNNDTGISSYHWMFGPTSLPIIPQTSYRDHRLLVLLLFMLLSTQSPLFSFVGVSLFFARLMHVESQYESTDRNPTMVLGATGNYWATLTVMDTEGRTASDTVWITVLQYVYPDNDHTTSWYVPR
jgi:PKD repeat protein